MAQIKRLNNDLNAEVLTRQDLEGDLEIFLKAAGDVIALAYISKTTGNLQRYELRNMDRNIVSNYINLDERGRIQVEGD